MGLFSCQDCREAFSEEAAYLEHCKLHPKGNCRGSLDEQLDSLRDAEKDSEATNFCTLCSVSFDERAEYLSHMENNHSQSSKNKESKSQSAKQHTYECPDCGKCYGMLGHLLNHQRSHRQPSKSLFHNIEHLKKKSFQCETCGRNYSRASALDAHRRCHEEKLVKPRNSSLRRSFGTDKPKVEAKVSENPTNTPEKLFTCSCGKAFPALMRLKTHQRFSLNSQCTPEDIQEKPKKSLNVFFCDECNKSFSGHLALFNHQRWHTNHSTDSAKRFSCEECGKEFMTLTFYYRHQRMAHSNEAPAKSFLHQVCQLQKKAFECKDCGLKFSRASALHSHQLHHSDPFKETEKLAQKDASLQPQPFDSGRQETEQLVEETETENVVLATLDEEHVYVHDSDEDCGSYEPGDFNVQVISASESEDEHVQDVNPDLELLCESDQEGRDLNILSSRIAFRPEMDLKIVQIDFEPAEEQWTPLVTEVENKSERFDCPECHRWFSSASSLHVHRRGRCIHRRRQQTEGQSVTPNAFDTSGYEVRSYVTNSSHIQKHQDEHASNDIFPLVDGHERKTWACEVCGKHFSRLSAFVSHQSHHSSQKLFHCLDCMLSYSNSTDLLDHMNTCPAQKKENISAAKKEYNPKKTLLGPKIYHCEQCGKGFWSLGAFSHHKQTPSQCADLRLRKDVTGSLHRANGSPRTRSKVACPVCGRKFRHKGIMTLHMRIHENVNHKCELCHRSFRLLSSLLRHQVVHNERLLPPPSKSFQHQVEQLQKNTYSCPDCGKLFSRAKALQFHMKSHGYETGHSPASPKAPVTVQDLQCSMCLAHFSNKASLRTHQRLCLKTVDYKTEKLDNTQNLSKDGMDVGSHSFSEQFVVNAEVKTEMDTRDLHVGQTVDHSENRNAADLKYKCKKCDRRFSVIGALNLHKRVHKLGRKSVAKAKSNLPPTLKQPKEEEPSEGACHCPECGKQFMSITALDSHKKCHTEKSVPRSMLKEQFFNHPSLQDHWCKTTSQPEPHVSVESSRDHPQFVRGLFLHHDKEHSTSSEGADPQEDRSQLTSGGPVDLCLQRSELKPNIHHCPLCSLTFAKARGLRAHKWQAHSKSTKNKNKVLLVARKQAPALSPKLIKTEDVSAVDNARVRGNVVTKNSPVGRGRKKMTLTSLHPNMTPCLDCGEPCSSAAALFHHRKACLNIKQEIQTPEAAGEASPPFNRLSEQTAKYLFKCGKCGKAFQTEEHLDMHKTKAKSRPFCCALCCHGFWTESQLQQHLSWHDEVRFRLPNEVRFRLSGAVTSKPLNPSSPPSDSRGKSLTSAVLNGPTPHPESPLQSSHKCQRCGQNFFSPAALHTHETQHCNNDSYPCSLCPRTFGEIQDLINHHQECVCDSKEQNDALAVVSSGDIDGLTCLECGTTFSEETELHQHYEEHVRAN